MQEKTTERIPNEALLSGLRELRQSLDRCIQMGMATQLPLHGRFGMFELTIGIAKLQEANLWFDQVAYRLGYKPHHESGRRPNHG